MKAIICNKYRSPEVLQLKEVIEADKIRAVIDKSYPLEQIIEAHSHVDLGHKKGNVVINHI